MSAIQLLTPQDVQRRLGISRSRYYRELPMLKRLGLKFFPILDGGAKDWRVTEDDYNKVVQKMIGQAREKEAKRRAYLKNKEARRA